MAQVILYIACSLDGYIARLDGSIEWLSEYEGEGEDYGYADFYHSIDCLVMGANTYRQVLSFGEWPYKGKKTYVFSNRKSMTGSEVEAFVSGGARQVLQKIGGLGFKRIWLVGGSQLVGSFCEGNLIDEYVITFIPILLGEGIPLFRPGCAIEHLELMQSHKYPGGLVQLHYRRTD